MNGKKLLVKWAYIQLAYLIQIVPRGCLSAFFPISCCHLVSAPSL